MRKESTTNTDTRHTQIFTNLPFHRLASQKKKHIANIEVDVVIHVHTFPFHKFLNTCYTLVAFYIACCFLFHLLFYFVSVVVAFPIYAACYCITRRKKKCFQNTIKSNESFSIHRCHLKEKKTVRI